MNTMQNATPAVTVLAFRICRYVPPLPGGTDLRATSVVVVAGQVYDGVQLVVNDRKRWDLFLPWGTGSRRAQLFYSVRARLLPVLVAAYEDEVANV